MSRRGVTGLSLGLCAFVAVSAACAEGPAPAAVPPTAAAPVGGAPKIAFDAVTVNVGDVVHGQDVVATFTYRNTGDAPLHILSAKPG